MQSGMGVAISFRAQGPRHYLPESKRIPPAPPEAEDVAVTSRIRSEDLVFSRPFRLRGWKEPHPAGTYALEMEEELIEGLSFPAYRRVGTTLTREATPGGHCRQVIPVELADLEVAVAAERAATGGAA
jgi:hypothetical protein